MISSKFCIEFFFRYNSKILITPIPEINFEEFQTILLQNQICKSSISLSMKDKFQEVIYICLKNFDFYLGEILQGNYQISQVLERLIQKFKSFLDIEFQCIYLYNQAKLHLFREIDYMTLSFKRILNFLQDLDHNIIKQLKKQALLDLFAKAFSQFYQEIIVFEPILEKNSENDQTFQVFLKIKNFLSEKLSDINENWASDSNRRLFNNDFSENLSVLNDETTPNKFRKSLRLHASKPKNNQFFIEIPDCDESLQNYSNFSEKFNKDKKASKYENNGNYIDNSHNFTNKGKNSISSESQIEIELKNMDFHENSDIKVTKNVFDETFLPLKESIHDSFSIKLNLFDNIEVARAKEKRLGKLQTKTMEPKILDENESINMDNRENKGFRTITNNNNHLKNLHDEVMDPKINLRKYVMENSKYQVKTKDKSKSLKNYQSYIQVNGVIFTDPIFLLDQMNNKEDFSLFKDLVDEDIDETYEPYTDNSNLFSTFNLKIPSMEMLMESSSLKEKEESISPKKKRKNQKQKSTKFKPKPKSTSKELNLLSPQQKSNSDLNNNSLQQVISQSYLGLGFNAEKYSNSSGEENEDYLQVSPLMNRQNFIKNTFIGKQVTRPNIIRSSVNINTSSVDMNEIETLNIDLMLSEPEILKAISISCGVNNNQSSVRYFAKWLILKKGNLRKKLHAEKVEACKSWILLRRIVRDYRIAKKKFKLAKNFNHFIEEKLYKNPDFIACKISNFDGIYIGKGMKQGQGEEGNQGQGEGRTPCESDGGGGEYIFVMNREIRKFGKCVLKLEDNQFLY